MAYTAAQIESLPISEESKAALRAKYGLVEDLGGEAPAPPPPTVMDFGTKPGTPAPPVTATPGGQPLSSGFATDPREAYVSAIEAKSGLPTEDAPLGAGWTPPKVMAPPKEAPPSTVTVGAPSSGPVPIGAPLPIPGPPKPVGAPAPMASGFAPSAQAPMGEGLYKGRDPLSFGKTPGMVKGDVITGQSMIGQKGFAEQQSAVDSQLADDYLGTATKIATDADAAEQVALKKAAQRKAFLDKYNAETERQIDDYVKSDIDPSRWWAEKGVGGTILAAIGVALGGFGSAVLKSRGVDSQGPIEFIEKQIQQDIDRQKAMIAKKGAGIEARRGLYASYLQQFGQEDAADAMAHEAYLRKIKTQVDAYAAKASSDTQKINAQAMSAALDDKIKLWAAGRQAAGESMIDAYDAAKAKAAAAYAAAQQAKADKYAEKIMGVELKSAEAVAEAFGKEGKQVETVLDGGHVVVRDPITKKRLWVSSQSSSPLEGGDGKGPKPINVVTGFSATGEPIYGGAAKPVSPKAGDDYLEKIDKLSKGYAALEQMKSIRKKYKGGKFFPESGDEAKAADLERDAFTGLKTLGENSDKDAERIQKVVPKVFDHDPKASVMGGPAYTDALIAQQQKKIQDEIKRLNAMHFQVAAPSTLPLQSE